MIVSANYVIYWINFMLKIFTRMSALKKNRSGERKKLDLYTYILYIHIWISKSTYDYHIILISEKGKVPDWLDL